MDFTKYEYTLNYVLKLVIINFIMLSKCISIKIIMKDAEK